MSNEVVSLLAIAKKNRADKPRHFFDIYSEYFEPIRNANIRLLEIGVHRGRSLKTWREYFPNGIIYGIEKDPIRDYNEDRIKVFIGDQGDPDFLKEVMSNIKGQLTIIIDDGSHVGRDQILSFETLFTKLEPRCGIYSIEDICTSYWMSREGGPVGKKGTAIDYLKKMIDIVAQGNSDIKSIGIYNNLCFMKRA